MSKRVLVLSKNDRWHKLEDLGAWVVEWAGALEGVEVDVRHDRNVLASDELTSYEACVLCITMQDLTDDEERGLTRYVSEGGAVYGIHSASVTDEGREKYIELIGARFVEHPPYQTLTVQIVDDGHPVTLGMAEFVTADELYLLDRTPRDARILAVVQWEGKAQPLVYVKSYGEGRVLYNALGHDATSYTHPAFRELIVHGLAWTCGMT